MSSATTQRTVRLTHALFMHVHLMHGYHEKRTTSGHSTQGQGGPAHAAQRQRHGARVYNTTLYRDP